MNLSRRSGNAAAAAAADARIRRCGCLVRAAVAIWGIYLHALLDYLSEGPYHTGYPCLTPSKAKARTPKLPTTSIPSAELGCWAWTPRSDVAASPTMASGSLRAPLLPETAAEAVAAATGGGMRPARAATISTRPPVVGASWWTRFRRWCDDAGIGRRELAFLAIAIPLTAGLGSISQWPGSTRVLIQLSFLAILSWIFTPFKTDKAWVSVLYMTVLPLGKVTTFEVAWAGAATETIWILFAGMVIAYCIKGTDFGKRLTFYLLRASPSKRWFLFNNCMVGMLLAFLIPSSVVRALFMIDITKAILDSMGWPFTGQPTTTSSALYLALGVSTVNCGSGILTATVPNLLIRGRLAVADAEPAWSNWLIEMFPAFGFLQAIWIFLGVLLVYGRRSDFFENYDKARARTLGIDLESVHLKTVSTVRGPAYDLDSPLAEHDSERLGEMSMSPTVSNSAVPAAEAGRAMSTSSASSLVSKSSLGEFAHRKLQAPPMSPKEAKVLVIVGVVVIMWILDVVTGLDATLIALMGVLLLTFPVIGPISFVDLKNLNFVTLIYIIGTIAMGTLCGSDTHFAKAVSSPLKSFVHKSGSLFGRLYFASLIAVVAMLLFGSIVSSSLLSAIYVETADELGMTKKQAGLCVASSLSMFLLPFESVPLLLAQDQGGLFDLGGFVRLMAFVSILNILISLPVAAATWTAIH